MRDFDFSRGDGIAFANPPRFIRRREAALYLQKTYGFGAYRTLAKGVVTGDSPAYRKAGKIVLYTRESLDSWALAKIGPMLKSSSDAVAE